MAVSAAMQQSLERQPAAEGLQVTPVDLKHLRRYTLGDAGLEREILDLFFGQLPTTIAALAAAATPKEWKVAAHTLKGSGRAVGPGASPASPSKRSIPKASPIPRMWRTPSNFWKKPPTKPVISSRPPTVEAPEAPALPGRGPSSTITL